MKTTMFGSHIIKAAESVLQVEYRAGTRNCYGEKLEQVVQEFDTIGKKKYFTGKGKKQVDYCGITVSVVLDRAMNAFDGTLNTFRSASAGEFLNLAKKNKIRVDKQPQAGCLFVTKRTGGSGYHIGLVWDVSGKNIKTIEGNTYSSSGFIVKAGGCKVKLGAKEYGIMSRMRPIANIHQFVHIEELYGATTSEYEPTQALLADGSNMESEVPANACSNEDYDANATGGEPSEPLSMRLKGIPKEYFYIGGGALAVAGIGFAIYKTRK
jgi:surface antigen